MDKRLGASLALAALLAGGLYLGNSQPPDPIPGSYRGGYYSAGVNCSYRGGIPGGGGGVVVSAPVGLGGGGWLEGGGIHPTVDGMVMLGADVVNNYTSTDGGLSFTTITKGFTNREDIHRFYAMDVLGIDNDDFTGFIVTTSGGIFSFDFDDPDTFVCMTPHDDPEGLYVSEVPQGTTNIWGYWNFVLPFTSVNATTDEDFLVASAGRYRYALGGQEAISTTNYPYRLSNVKFANPVGRQLLWYYDFNATTPRWLPVEDEYDAWNPDHGTYTEVDIAVVGTDTLIVCASQLAGPQMYNLTTKTWTDLAAETWNAHDGSKAIINEWSYYISSSSLTQSCESIMITDRGTVYTVVGTDDAASTIKSGVYRMHDATTPENWEWVGDQTEMPWVSYSDTTATVKGPVDERASGDGVGSRYVFNTLSGNQGSGTDPDTLWVGDRGYSIGVSKIIVPYGEGVSYDQLQTWVPGTWMWNFQYQDRREPTDSFDANGWNFWQRDTGITFQPAVHPRNANEVIVQSGTQLFKTEDGGTSWTSLEPKKYTPDLDFNSTRGYIELCTNDIAILPDGRLAVSSGDFGLGISIDSDNWAVQENPNVLETVRGEESASVDPCDWAGHGARTEFQNAGYDSLDLDTTMIVNESETAAIHSEPNWKRSGRGALFYMANRRISTGNGMGNLIMRWDSDDDGDDDATSITAAYTAGVDTADFKKWRYNYWCPFATKRDGDDFTIYAPYQQAETSACVGDWVDWGVHTFFYDESADTWTLDSLNVFNDFDWGQTVTTGASVKGTAQTVSDIVYSSFVNKLYMATEVSANWGSVYELDLDDPIPTWVEILGRNSFTGDPSDERDRAQDPRTLAISADGSVVYVATRGEQGYTAGVWKLSDLTNTTVPVTNPTWDLPTIEFLINNPAKTTAWATMPPARYGEILTSRYRAPSVSRWSPQIDSSVTGMLVNPTDPDQFWFTVKTKHKLHPDKGVYAYDSDTNVMVQIAGESHGGHVLYADENMAYDSFHTPNRIVIGSDCNGVFWIPYDGTFHTDGETTKPLLAADTSKEYGPNGLYAENDGGHVRLYWNATPNYQLNGLTGYYVYRGTVSGGPYTKISSLLTPTFSLTEHFSYTDDTVTNGVDYFYVMTSNYGAGGESEYGTEIKATPRDIGLNPDFSNEDFNGDGADATKWVYVDAGNIRVEYGKAPFFYEHDPDSLVSAQGFVCDAPCSGYSSAQNGERAFGNYRTNTDDWMLYTAYVKAVPQSLGVHSTKLRYQTDAGICDIVLDWGATEDVLVLGSTTGNDGDGYEYIGDGWFRIYFYADLVTRGHDGEAYHLPVYPYLGSTTDGNGFFIWGINVTFHSSEPTEWCHPLRHIPIEDLYEDVPEYWGDEPDCTTLP